MLEIRRPSIESFKQLNHFFRIVITDTFNKEGIGDNLEDLEQEIEMKKAYLESDINSNGENRYFLFALEGDIIIGSIEYGPASNLIKTCTNNVLKDLPEVGTVFVHPDYQRNGVGNLLLREIYLTLMKKGIEEFCLDSGYRNAQKIWNKKFGEPDYLLKDFWGEGYDHMIWKVKVKDVF
ncbi:GNAT family N-acetyltransferase [Neobacillus terrae]|uniref:GNAT family N-acetyltransferase n=1 Tax=Neobacillus terrae TaxID=3034837 RepID=UPI00140E0B1C|nr:GNAT family N-acetyltransferase [Neobacillus terrae]